MDTENLSDEELLMGTAREPTLFGVFYARHERLVFRWLYARTRDIELAADLAAETFAAALLASRRFRPGPEPAVAWLFGIARNVLGRSLRRRRVEDRARRRLGMPRLDLTDETVEVLERLHAGGRISDALARLPEAQRVALQARIVDEDDYAVIAGRLRCSEAVVRQRVSRGLARLRAELEEAP